MGISISQAVDEAGRLLLDSAQKNAYGDVSVTITMHEGHPVKITHSVCEHIAKRSTRPLVVNKQRH